MHGSDASNTLRYSLQPPKTPIPFVTSRRILSKAVHVDPGSRNGLWTNRSVAAKSAYSDGLHILLDPSVASHGIIRTLESESCM
uniref:Uncharacterized protein n=1 Tax=Moniliophthora roreri TaxID=221103 RepID=A0A0W0F018_MONRR